MRSLVGEHRVVTATAALSLSLLAGLAISSEPTAEKIQNYGSGALTEPSKIVEGVGVQLEDRKHIDWPFPLRDVYVVGVEQCSRDVENAMLLGQSPPSLSFDPEVNAIGTDCVFDWVQVVEESFYSHEIGDRLIIGDEVGAPTDKPAVGL